MIKTNYKKAVLGAAAAGVAGLLLVSCAAGGQGGQSANSNSEFDAALTGWANPSEVEGGTLNLMLTNDCDSWDPANSYFNPCWRLMNTFARGLMGYAALPGAENAGKVVNDLATGPGQPSEDLTTWTYALKDGIKWNDGTEVTSNDIKTALERLFATDVTGGGPGGGVTSLIAHPEGYSGPFRDGPLDSIQTPDEKTVVIQLSQPFADLDSILAMPVASAVPSHMGLEYLGANYAKAPMSTGPFELSSHKANQEVTFVRNEEWDQAGDDIRHPLVDEIDVVISSNLDDIDLKLENGQAHANASQGVQAAFRSKILTDPALKADSDVALTGSTTYLSILPAVAPLDNVHCRRAIFYAIDKSSLQRASGGTSAGEIARGMANPTVEGYDQNFDPYPSGADDSGDLAKAEEELKECGQPDGFKTKMTYSTSFSGGPEAFEAAQQSLARVGIEIESSPGDPATYYSQTFTNPNRETQGIGIALTGWSGDNKTPFGFWSNLVNNPLETPETSEEVLQILDSSRTGGATEEDWAKVNELVMDQAIYLPYLYSTNLLYRSPELTNVRVDFARGGGYDWVNMGVQ